MRYLPSVLQVLGAVAVVAAIGALAGVWVAVGVGGLILAGAGYVMEPDDA